MTKQFYLLSNGGLVVLLISVLLYYMQGKPDMFDMLRPYVIIINLLTLGWFITLQYYRFKETGRACSGDFVHPNFVTKQYNKASASWSKSNSTTSASTPAPTEESTTV